MLSYAFTTLNQGGYEDVATEEFENMSGNKISVRTLDLNREFSDIAAQLNKIVAEHFENQ